MAAIGFLTLMSYKSIKKIHLVFPNKMLLEKDQEDFSDLWTLMQMERRVEYHSDIAFKPTHSELVILDEGDFFVFGKPKEFHQFSKKTMLIVLSATSDGGDAVGTEAKVLKVLGF